MESSIFIVGRNFSPRRRLHLSCLAGGGDDRSAAGCWRCHSAATPGPFAAWRSEAGAPGRGCVRTGATRRPRKTCDVKGSQLPLVCAVLAGTGLTTATVLYGAARRYRPVLYPGEILYGRSARRSGCRRQAMKAPPARQRDGDASSVRRPGLAEGELRVSTTPKVGDGEAYEGCCGYLFFMAKGGGGGAGHLEGQPRHGARGAGQSMAQELPAGSGRKADAEPPPSPAALVRTHLIMMPG